MLQRRVARTENTGADAFDALKRILDVARLDDAIYALTDLGIPELLTAEPRSVTDLAAESRTRPELLVRLLRFLVAGGVCTEPRPGEFALTEMGKCLRGDAPRSMRPLVLFRGQQFKRHGWLALSDVMRTGDVAFDKLNGAPLFEFLDAHADARGIFDAAMTGLTRAMTGVVTSHYDFSAAGLIVDVGGGEGALLIEVLSAHPGARGVLFDLRSVADAAREAIAAAGLADRCTVASGSFFQAIPTGGDLYVMKMILHDWPDERAELILGNCRAAMDLGARLLVIERVLPPAPPYDLEPFMLDLVMLLELGALERTESQWQALFARAGFALTRVIPTTTPFHIIEARPV